ncbi:hydantoin racemase, partial [Thermococci archaeon]
MSSLMLLIPIGVLVGASILGLVGRGKSTLHAVNILSATASLLIVYIAILGFERGLELKLWVYASSSVIASLNQLIFKVDQLSAFFLLILGILGFCTSLYGIKYMERYLGKEDLRLYNFNYPIFLLMMYLILTCWNLLWFIIFWELMTFFSQ